jgi:hypothetical protein
MKLMKIEALRKKYRKEWLLIAIEKMDMQKTVPLAGRLLAHSCNREEIDEKSMKYKKPALVVYSENNFPKGYAAAF